VTSVFSALNGPALARGIEYGRVCEQCIYVVQDYDWQCFFRSFGSRIPPIFVNDFLLTLWRQITNYHYYSYLPPTNESTLSAQLFLILPNKFANFWAKPPYLRAPP
jgi:hypothetical protein